VEDRLEKNPWVKKARWLSHALLISGALNIGLLGSFFMMTYKNLKQVKPSSIETATIGKASYISSSGMELLHEYFHYSYEELKNELERKELVEDGYAKRDYALACLVGLHYFDVYKALAGRIVQTRVVEIVHKEGGERLHLEMFPGLEDAHFHALSTFARVEKWPFTPHGLYVKMQSIHELCAIPSSLKEAFCLTPHFYYIKRLFQQEDYYVPEQQLLESLLGIEWEQIEAWYQELYKMQDFGLETRRKFLLPLVHKGSPLALHFFLEHDRDFALAKLDDGSIVAMLKLVTADIPQAESFVRKLLVSVRSDEVLKAAGSKLYQLAGESPPQPYDHSKALLRFLPNFFDKASFTPKERRHEKESVIPLAGAKRSHEVVKGDNLWKIAALYQVDLKALMKKNGLTASSIIKPGMKLDIP